MNKLKFLAFVLVLCSPLQSLAQISDVIQWQVYTEKINNNSSQLVVEAEIIAPGWHFWTLDLKNDMLIPTRIDIDQKEIVQTDDQWEVTGEVIHREDEIFGPIEYYEGDQIIFRKNTQAPSGTAISGTITYQACNESTCLPPKTVPFEVLIN